MNHLGLWIADSGLASKVLRAARSDRGVPNPQSPIRSRRAFTLTEMAVSLGVLSILLLAMGGAVAISAKALPTPGAPVQPELSLGSGIERLAAELRYAKTVESSGATFVQFTVADRNSDGSDEHIRYQWGGAGQALTRTYNSGAAVPVSDALTNFSLTFQNNRVTTSQTVNGVVDSGEVMFTNCYGWGGVIPIQTNGVLNSTNWCMSYFKPDAVTFPTGVNYVAITRVRVKLKKTSSPDGAAITCGIYRPAAPGGPSPSTTQVGSNASIATSSLTTSYPSTLNDFVFSDVTFTTPPTELNFVIKGTGTSCGSVMYYNALLALLNTPVWQWTSTSGASWGPTGSLLTQNDGYFEVYGSYRYPTSSTQSVDTYYLHQFTVKADSAGPTHAEMTMRALNQPVVAGP